MKFHCSSNLYMNIILSSTLNYISLLSLDGSIHFWWPHYCNMLEFIMVTTDRSLFIYIHPMLILITHALVITVFDRATDVKIQHQSCTPHCLVSPEKRRRALKHSPCVDGASLLSQKKSHHSNLTEIIWMPINQN